MKSSKRFKLIFLPLVMLSLTACGGGDDDPATTTKKTPANIAPVVSNVTITDDNGGDTVIGDTLTGKYKFDDPDTGDTDVSTFRWLNDTGTELGTKKTYQIASADASSVITFEVKAVSSGGVKEGNTDTSASITVVAAGGNTGGTGGNTGGTGGNTGGTGGNTGGTGGNTGGTGGNTGGTGGNTGTTANVAPTVDPYITLTTAGVLTAKITKASVNDVLVANVGYKDADNDPIDPAMTKYEWMNGTTVLTNETNPAQHTMAATDTSITVKVTVQSKAGTGVDVKPVFKISAPPVLIATVAANNVAPVATVDVTTGANGPVNTDLTTATAIPGDTLTGVFNVTDADTNPVDTLGPHSYQWYYDLGKGEFDTIDDADLETYDVLPEDEGMTLVFEVTPIAQTGTSPGEPVKALGILVNSAPTADTVVISKSVATAPVALDSVLNATFTYDDVDVPKDKAGTHTYKWFRNDVEILEADNPSAITANYKVIAADLGVGASLFVEVTPVALTGTSPGASLMSKGFVMDPLVPTVSKPVIEGATGGTGNAAGTIAEIGDTLIGTYMINDATPVAVDDKSTFKWTLSDGKTDSVSKIVKNEYVVQLGDQGKTITLEVTPIDANGTGTPIASDPLIVNSAPTVVDTIANPFVITVKDVAGPTGKAVTGTATVHKGNVLTASYTYFDADKDVQGATVMELIRTTGTGPSATTKSLHTLTFPDAASKTTPMVITHTVKATDLVDDVFTLVVTPIASTGTTDGLTVTTPGLKVVAAPVVIPPTTTIVSMTSSNADPTIAVEGDTLTVVHTPGDAGQNPSTIIWVNVSIDPDTSAIIRGADLAGTADQSTYIVGAPAVDAVGTLIAAEITPVASDGTLGTPVLSVPVTVEAVP